MRLKLFVFLISLVLIGSGLSLPTTVSAQSGNPTTAVCQDDLTGLVYFVPTTGNCPAGYTLRSVSGKFPALCVVGPPFNVEAPVASGGANSTYSCTNGTLKTIAPAPASPNPTPTPTPTPKPTPTPTQNPPADSGECGTGFEAKGPLCIPVNPFASNGGVAGSGSVGALATTIISTLLGFAGIVAVIFIIIGGYYWMTARGNDAQAIKARKTLTNAIIGLIIVILSYMIIQVVTTFVTKGPGG